ncbi:MAG: DUF3823 domain-containing protein [Mangrovibacterium sp.]
MSNENLSLNGSTLTATFTVTGVAATQQLERAILVVNKTSFVDENAQIARADQLAPGTGQITMTLELTEAVLSSTLLNAARWTQNRRKSGYLFLCCKNKIKAVSEGADSL